MNTHKLSRRQLLIGLLATLTAWVCPRPPRPTPASRRSIPIADRRPSEHARVTIFTYDARGRLLREEQHPLHPCEPSAPCARLTTEHTIYDCYAEREEH
ncbi:MAG TPA: hypothetical protein VH575_34840 [Gemmataceae bacterium]|jgi:hypothetical protein